MYDVRCPWAIQRFDEASDFALHIAEEQDAHIKHQERLRRLHREGKLTDDEVKGLLQSEADFSRRVFDTRPKYEDQLNVAHRFSRLTTLAMFVVGGVLTVWLILMRSIAVLQTL